MIASLPEQTGLSSATCATDIRLGITQSSRVLGDLPQGNKEKLPSPNLRTYKWDWGFLKDMLGGSVLTFAQTRRSPE
jgi:hypothetical protein